MDIALNIGTITVVKVNHYSKALIKMATTDYNYFLNSLNVQCIHYRNINKSLIQLLIVFNYRT